MTEQTTAATQIATALESMKTQGDQAARATAEQARTMAEMTKAADATARDIRLITTANTGQSAAAARLVDQLENGRSTNGHRRREAESAAKGSLPRTSSGRRPPSVTPPRATKPANVRAR